MRHHIGHHRGHHRFGMAGFGFGNARNPMAMGGFGAMGFPGFGQGFRGGMAMAGMMSRFNGTGLPCGMGCRHCC